MERFLQRARELIPLSEVFVMPSRSGGAYRLRVLYGDFASREEALAAGRRLPPRYQEAFTAVPRSVAELRSQI
jgi:septal ring-binding cell division protein DamX